MKLFIKHLCPFNTMPITALINYFFYRLFMMILRILRNTTTVDLLNPMMSKCQLSEQLHF